MENRIRYRGEPPFTRAEALSEGRGTYMRALDTGKYCPLCHCDVVYTETNECVACVGQALWLKAKANPTAYPIGTQAALDLGLDYTINGRYCHGGPHLMSPSISPSGSKCVLCDEAKKNTPRKVAKRNRETWYMPTAPCKYCDGLHLKKVANGECQGCMNNDKAEALRNRVLSPRALAEKAGAAKYLPDTPCPKCHGVHMKRVNNGACDGCKALSNEAREKALAPQLDRGTRDVIAAMGPDYLVDRKQAKAMGLSAYRDGKYCVEGHTGWKFLANDACVTCGGDI